MAVTRPGLVVAIAIVLSLPMAPGILDGAIAPTTALLRFLVAILLCWGGSALVTGVLRRYVEQSRRAQLTRMLEDARRRAAEQRAAANPAGSPPPHLPGQTGPPPGATGPAMPSSPPAG